jgi:hypothetical protein
MEREDERGVAKQPDLNELNVPEWAELALDKIGRRELATARLQTAAHCHLGMETAREPQSGPAESAATRMWGSIGSAEIFAEGIAYTTTKWDVHRAGLARYRQGVVGG